MKKTDIRKILIIGAGKFGTALAKVISPNVEVVTIYTKNEDQAFSINSNHINSRHFPEYKLPENIFAGTSMSGCLEGVDTIILAIPSGKYRNAIMTLGDFLIPGKKYRIISTAKGLEESTNMLPSQIVEEGLKGFKFNYFALSGPNFAKEIMDEVPTATVLASNKFYDSDSYLLKIFQGPLLRPYLSRSIKTTEWGGILKNVFTAGMAMAKGANAKSALFTRALAEIKEFLKSEHVLRINQAVLSLAVIGDFYATSTSPLSRNKRFGELLAAGKTPDEAKEEISDTVESFHTIPALYNIAQIRNLDMPILYALHGIYSGILNVREAESILMARPLKTEETNNIVLEV